MNSFRPPRHHEVVTPLYFSGGLAADLPQGCNRHWTERRVCVVAVHVNFPTTTTPSSASQVQACQTFLSRQLVVVHSDRRGQRSMVNQSCTKQCHRLVLHGW